MDLDEAKAKERPAIQIGATYLFFSTAQESVSDQGAFLRTYTAQPVRVRGAVDIDPDEQVEQLWQVQADNGDTFDAYEGELNGWYRDTGQFYGKSGTWGTEE